MDAKQNLSPVDAKRSNGSFNGKGLGRAGDSPSPMPAWTMVVAATIWAGWIVFLAVMAAQRLG